MHASMGPGCFYPGNGLGPMRQDGAQPASMGPGCFYPGNLDEAAVLRSFGRLQWGRDVSIPEMGWPLGIAPVIPKASMGPGCFYPGNTGSGVGVELRTIASMGPGCFYPGNNDWCNRAERARKASMGPGCFYPGNHAAMGHHSYRLDASMGPGCFYPGNSTWTPADAPPSRLQWGRDVSIPEMGADGRIVWVFNVLQWGRDVSIPEIPPTL